MDEKCCPLSGKSCTSMCAWFTNDDCNFGNLYYIANKVSNMADQLEEIKDSIDDLNETMGG
ncbi:MAG: hypothetical protein NC489_35510, partial [Ruminococcus flavefaciens]|nr:hypothetical protein [Ruminococcus flavefaciens]